MLDVNLRQKERLADLVYQNENHKASIAVYGFSYKKNTSDTRCTPAARVIRRLARKGFRVRVHDPMVTPSGFEAEMKLQEALDGAAAWTAES